MYAPQALPSPLFYLITFYAQKKTPREIPPRRPLTPALQCGPNKKNVRMKNQSSPHQVVFFFTSGFSSSKSGMVRGMVRSPAVPIASIRVLW